MKRRNFVLLLGGASSGAMSVGTGAFSSVEAERDVAVNVVEDEEAYLGLTADPDDETLVRVRNQFTDSLELTLGATVRDSSNAVKVEESGEEIVIEIDSGGSGSAGGSTVTDIGTGTDLDIAVDCETAGTYTLELSFHGEVEGSGTTVDKDRTFKTTTISAVQFPGGSGKAEIESDVGGTVSGTAYYRDRASESIESYPLEDQEVNRKFGPNAGGIDGEVVAVDLNDLDGVFWRADRKPGDGNRVHPETAAERDGPPSS
jgi:molybdenum-dependent DNA-binding transcriptional regulator ModE